MARDYRHEAKRKARGITFAVIGLGTLMLALLASFRLAHGPDPAPPDARHAMAAMMAAFVVGTMTPRRPIGAATAFLMVVLLSAAIAVLF